MRWRDRLALWCLRLLAPAGLGEHGMTLAKTYDSGLSDPGDPKLVMRLDTPKGQRLISIVLDPDTIVGELASVVAELRDWANR